MTALAPPTAPPIVDQFHPAVAAWFARRFPDGPTPPQVAAWPHIAAGSDVLVASPTGTGKTLTGFLVAIDAAYRAAEAAGTAEAAETAGTGTQPGGQPGGQSHRPPPRRDP